MCVQLHGDMHATSPHDLSTTVQFELGHTAAMSPAWHFDVQIFGKGLRMLKSLLLNMVVHMDAQSKDQSSVGPPLTNSTVQF
jgi:hypothetical protein